MQNKQYFFLKTRVPKRGEGGRVRHLGKIPKEFRFLFWMSPLMPSIYIKNCLFLLSARIAGVVLHCISGVSGPSWKEGRRTCDNQNRPNYMVILYFGITAVSSRNIKREHLNGKMILTLFLHTIVNVSWFFGFLSNVGACWWYLVVTQHILVLVIGGFSSSC